MFFQVIQGLFPEWWLNDWLLSLSSSLTIPSLLVISQSVSTAFIFAACIAPLNQKDSFMEPETDEQIVHFLLKLHEAVSPASFQLEGNNVINLLQFFPFCGFSNDLFSAKICKVWISCSSAQLLLWGLGKNSSPDTTQVWSCSCRCHVLELPWLMCIKWYRDLPRFPCSSVLLNLFMRAETVGNKVTVLRRS